MIDLSRQKFFSPYFATHACASAVFDSKMSITVRVASVFMTAISAFIETLSYIANGVRSATKWVFCCNSVNKEISKVAQQNLDSVPRLQGPILTNNKIPEFSPNPAVLGDLDISHIPASKPGSVSVSLIAPPSSDASELDPFGLFPTQHKTIEVVFRGV